MLRYFKDRWEEELNKEENEIEEVMVDNSGTAKDMEGNVFDEIPSHSYFTKPICCIARRV